MKAFIEYAKANGLKFTLYVKEGARISKPLLDAIKSVGGVIQRIPKVPL